jgi:hypothetical protein
MSNITFFSIEAQDGDTVKLKIIGATRNWDGAEARIIQCIVSFFLYILFIYIYIYIYKYQKTKNFNGMK